MAADISILSIFKCHLKYVGKIYKYNKYNYNISHKNETLQGLSNYFFKWNKISILLIYNQMYLFVTKTLLKLFSSF